MTKMPELMMLAPYFLKISDIEDIVKAVNLGKAYPSASGGTECGGDGVRWAV